MKYFHPETIETYLEESILTRKGSQMIQLFQESMEIYLRIILIPAD